MNAQEQKIKEKLLMDLIAHMDDGMGERLAPKKALSVEVAAPDKAHLSDALSKAKEMLSGADHPESSEDDESDEDRLRALLSGAGDDEDEEDHNFKSRF